MKTLIVISLLASVAMSACTESAYQATSQSLQEKMKEIDKTDLAKVEGAHKDKVENKRQNGYHQYANDADKKLNHHKNEQLNQKKGWDGNFGFY